MWFYEEFLKLVEIVFVDVDEFVIVVDGVLYGLFFEVLFMVLFLFNEFWS